MKRLLQQHGSTGRGTAAGSSNDRNDQTTAGVDGDKKKRPESLEGQSESQQYEGRGGREAMRCSKGPHENVLPCLARLSH